MVLLPEVGRTGAVASPVPVGVVVAEDVVVLGDEVVDEDVALVVDVVVIGGVVLALTLVDVVEVEATAAALCVPGSLSACSYFVQEASGTSLAAQNSHPTLAQDHPGIQQPPPDSDEQPC